MECPHCDSLENCVIDSRYVPSNECIRRRRECNGCGRRFTTYERIEGVGLSFVKKRNGNKEVFNRDKLLNSIREACNKRPVAHAGIHKMTSNVCRRLLEGDENEPATTVISECVIDELAKVDLVACVRYSSIQFNFDNLEEFKKGVMQIKKFGEEIMSGTG